MIERAVALAAYDEEAQNASDVWNGMWDQRAHEAADLDDVNLTFANHPSNGSHLTRKMDSELEQWTRIYRGAGPMKRDGNDVDAG